MADLISRDHLTETIRAEIAEIEKKQFMAAKYDDYVSEISYRAVINFYRMFESIVLAEPAVKGEPAKRDKGEWRWLGCTGTDLKEGEYECSLCNHRVITYNSRPWEHFCPSCGADMKGELR